jgi:hypothetical protein
MIIVENTKLCWGPKENFLWIRSLHTNHILIKKTILTLMSTNCQNAPSP